MKTKITLPVNFGPAEGQRLKKAGERLNMPASTLVRAATAYLLDALEQEGEGKRMPGALRDRLVVAKARHAFNRSEHMLTSDMLRVAREALASTGS